MILTATLGLPMLGALVIAVSRRWTETTARLFAVGVSLLPVFLLAWAWLQFDTQGALFQFVEEVPWVPSLGMGYRLGVDGIALAVATMSALVFSASIAYPVDTKHQPRQYYAWMLFLQSVSLGVFLALDLLLFYVFFDLFLLVWAGKLSCGWRNVLLIIKAPLHILELHQNFTTKTDRGFAIEACIGFHIVFNFRVF